MRKLIIAEFVGDLARQYVDDESSYGPPRDIKTFEAGILADIQVLIKARAIRPKIAATDEPPSEELPLDPTWCLDHRDVERVVHYARNDDADRKRAYIEELTACYHEGRYSLAEAADAIAEGSGEQYKTILKRLKLAVINEELTVYRRGHNLKYMAGEKRTHVSQVCQFSEEALWCDLNNWLEERESLITFRFPPPIIPEPTVFENENAIELTDDVLNDDYSEDEKTAPGPPPPLSRQRWQEREIVRTLIDLRYDPLALPTAKRGERGVRWEVRKRCSADNPDKWIGSVFDKAWDRVSALGMIKKAD